VDKNFYGQRENVKDSLYAIEDIRRLLRFPDPNARYFAHVLLIPLEIALQHLETIAVQIVSAALISSSKC